METIIIDTLEIDHGTDILSQLCEESLTRNQQSTRLFDQTKNSAEVYCRADNHGKPYIQDFQNGKRWYPITAYAKAHGLEFNAAKEELIRQYYGEVVPARTTYIPARVERPTLVIDYLPAELYQPCQNHFERNGLYEYLRFTYGLEAANNAFTRYQLGTSRHWRYLGCLSTCLPQFDINGNLRQVKVMPFDAMNGRRVKKHQPAERWNLKKNRYESTAPDSDKIFFAGKQIAKQAGKANTTLKQCFFGEHLLTKFPGQPVALVEGESTAIVCSILWPQFTWLATGGSTGGSWYSPDRFSVLRGHDVTLWPDTGKYDDWSQKANAVRPLVRSLKVSDYVEKNTPAGMGNVDLRDLLTRPAYFPNGESQPIYGEVLSVEFTDTYPFEWDQPSADRVPLYQLSNLNN